MSNPFETMYGFAAAAGKGAWEGLADTADGLRSLAKSGAQLFTDATAREQAWQTTKQISAAVKNYAKATVDDPAKPFRDSRNGVLAAYESFDQAKNKAATEGKSNEFWGNLVGRGSFEVTLFLVPAGIATKVGKSAKAIRAVEAAEEASSAAARVKILAAAPVLHAADDVVSCVVKCPKQKPLVILDALLQKASEAKAEIDDLAEVIARQHGGKVAKAPLKSQERAMEKIMVDYGGNASRIKDLARNTIVVPAGKEKDALANLLKTRPEIDPSTVKIIDSATDPLGYSGINVSVSTKAGIPAEIQINSPEMIFAKEKPEIARAILGDDAYDKIAGRPGMPVGGKGHEFYEQWRSLDAKSPQAKAVEAQSREYYNAFRR